MMKNDDFIDLGIELISSPAACLWPAARLFGSHADAAKTELPSPQATGWLDVIAISPLWLFAAGALWLIWVA